MIRLIRRLIDRLFGRPSSVPISPSDDMDVMAWLEETDRRLLAWLEEHTRS